MSSISEDVRFGRNLAVLVRVSVEFTADDVYTATVLKDDTACITVVVDGLAVEYVKKDDDDDSSTQEISMSFIAFGGGCCSSRTLWWSMFVPMCMQNLCFLGCFETVRQHYQSTGATFHAKPKSTYLGPFFCLGDFFRNCILPRGVAKIISAEITGPENRVEGPGSGK